MGSASTIVVNFLLKFFFLPSFLKGKGVGGPPTVGEETLSDQVLEVLLLFLARTPRVVHVLRRIRTVAGVNAAIICYPVVVLVQLRHVVKGIRDGEVVLGLVWAGRGVRGLICDLLVSLLFTLVFLGAETAVNYELLHEVVLRTSERDEAVSNELLAVTPALRQAVRALHLRNRFPPLLA